MKIFNKNEINILLKNSPYYKKMLTKGKKISEGLIILGIYEKTLGQRSFNRHQITAHSMVTINCPGCGSEKIIPFQHLINNICLYCKSCKYKNVSNTMTGRHHSKETKLKMSKSHLGKTVSEETKRKMSRAKAGKNHPNWGKRKEIKKT